MSLAPEAPDAAAYGAPTGLHLRACTAADLADLERMVLALYVNDVVGEPMTPVKVRRTLDALQLHPDRGRILIGEVAGAVIAYAIVIWFWSNEYGGLIGVIDELYVEAPWRGRGIGSALFDAVLEQQPELVALDLEVSPENQSAMAWYQRRGFVPTRNRTLRRLRQSSL